MAAPIVFGQFSYVLMQFVDQVMVARLGTEELAATGPAGLWFFIFSTFFLGISGCVSTFAAQSLGRGEQEQGASYAWQGVYIGLVGGVFGMAIWPFADDLFGVGVGVAGRPHHHEWEPRTSCPVPAYDLQDVVLRLESGDGQVELPSLQPESGQAEGWFRLDFGTV